MVRDPLGVRTYVVRNRRRILPAFIMIAFIVGVVVVVLSTLRGLKEGALRYTREFRIFTVVLPKKEAGLSKAHLDGIRAHGSVDRVIASRNCFVRVRTLIGWLPFQLRGVSRVDMAFLMERAGLRVREGRLPAEGTAEVAVHEWLMRANGWSVGQEFGTDVDDDDWMPGRFQVVGILEGDVPMGFASVEYLTDDVRYAFAPKLWERVLAVPGPGRIGEMNDFLRSLSGVKAFDARRAEQEVDELFDRIVLITDFVSVVLILVVAVVVGLLNNLFFSQRMDEFAILMAIGWKRGRLVRKALGESNLIAGAAWVAGLAGGLGVLAAFEALVLAPRGVFIPTLQAVPVLVSLGLPGVAILFSGATVMRRLTRLDPVAIIERRG